MNKALLLSTLSLILIAPPSSMLADTIFDFSFSGGAPHGVPGQPFSGSGQIDVEATGVADKFTIVGITGDTAGVNIVGLDSGTISYDSASGSLVNLTILYELSGGIQANLFFSGGPGTYQSYVVTLEQAPTQNSLGYNEVEPIHLNVTEVPAMAAATPEPSALVLLATGGLGLTGAAAGRLRRTKRAKP